MKKMKDQGFGILETVVAMGVVGLVALASLKISDIASFQNKSAASNEEVGVAAIQVSNILQDQASCDNNLFDRSLNATNLEVVDIEGGVILAPGLSLSTRTTIKDVFLEKNGTPDSGTGIVILNVLITKEVTKKTSELKETTIKRSFPIMVKTVGGKIESCVSSIEGGGDEVAKEICEMTGGIYDEVNYICDNDQPPIDLVSACEMFSGSYSLDGSNKPSCDDVKIDNVQVTNKELSNTLGIEGNYLAYPNPIANPACKDGEYLRGLNQDGSYICETIAERLPASASCEDVTFEYSAWSDWGPAPGVAGQCSVTCGPGGLRNEVMTRTCIGENCSSECFNLANLSRTRTGQPCNTDVACPPTEVPADSEEPAPSSEESSPPKYCSCSAYYSYGSLSGTSSCICESSTRSYAFNARSMPINWGSPDCYDDYSSYGGYGYSDPYETTCEFYNVTLATTDVDMNSIMGNDPSLDKAALCGSKNIVWQTPDVSGSYRIEGSSDSEEDYSVEVYFTCEAPEASPF